MTEPQGFLQWDAATRILSRPALSYADFLPVPDLSTDEGLEAASNPAPLKVWPAVSLVFPEGYVPVRRLVGFGDRAVQMQADLEAEGGAIVVREGELWAMAPRQAEEQCNHPSGLSGWGWVEPEQPERRKHAKAVPDA